MTNSIRKQIEAKFFFFLLSFFVFSSCGYHFEGSSGSAWKTSVTVPYVQGDYEGRMTDALISALSRSSVFECVQSDGRFILHAALIGSSDERVGFRYDRDDISGKLRDNLVGTENRKIATVEVKLTDSITGDVVFGPELVSADAVYDYVDYNSLEDLSFIDSYGVRVPIIDFSLGQLDSREGATIDALTPLYRSIAQKIVDGIIVSQSNEQ